MKETELRIGNLIQVKGEIITVDEIMGEAGSVWGINSAYGTPETWGSDIEPIPITEERLVELGFSHHRETNGYLNYTNGKITLDHEFSMDLFDGRPDDSLTKSYRPPLRYVHQLQNLYFALTGEELTIKPTEV